MLEGQKLSLTEFIASISRQLTCLHLLASPLCHALFSSSQPFPVLLIQYIHGDLCEVCFRVKYEDSGSFSFWVWLQVHVYFRFTYESECYISTKQHWGSTVMISKKWAVSLSRHSSLSSWDGTIIVERQAHSILSNDALQKSIHREYCRGCSEDVTYALHTMIRDEKSAANRICDCHFKKSDPQSRITSQPASQEENAFVFL